MLILGAKSLKVFKRIRSNLSKKNRKNSLKHKRLLVYITAISILFLAGFFYYSDFPKHSPKLLKGNTLSDLYLSECKDERCLKTGLERITAEYGAKLAGDALTYYTEGANAIIGDIHLRAHYIGRKLANLSDISAQTFNECPTTFNYGCHHGYFEVVLGRTSTPVQAVNRICSSIESDSKQPANFLHHCYHGAGHGIMMSLAYDLEASLDVCDQLASTTSQASCWQGVFMENVNGRMQNQQKKGVFSKQDTLAPCSSVDEKYKRECYINHHPYLLSLYNWSAERASHDCLGAGTHTATCIEGMGIAITSPAWQKLLVKDRTKNDAEKNGWEICSQFPQNYIEACVTGAVTQIIQREGTELRLSSKFCSLVESQYSFSCFQRIGHFLRSESTEPLKTAQNCQKLPAAGREICRNAILN